jgi:predicted DNA-binding transcriptional regulator AlpA
VQKSGLFFVVHRSAPPDKGALFAVDQNPAFPSTLLTKQEILAITKKTYPTIWTWMMAGKFPRSRIVGGSSMWLSSEVADWLAGLQVRPLKGDATPDDGAPAPRKRRHQKSREQVSR